MISPLSYLYIKAHTRMHRDYVHQRNWILILRTKHPLQIYLLCLSYNKTDCSFVVSFWNPNISILDHHSVEVGNFSDAIYGQNRFFSIYLQYTWCTWMCGFCRLKNIMKLMHKKHLLQKNDFTVCKDVCNSLVSSYWLMQKGLRAS